MKTIGILGAGQLARMLALAAYPLGIRTLCLDPNPQTSASDVCTVIKAEYTDMTALKHFAELVDVITLENENIPVASLQELHQYRSIWPNASSISFAQDRLYEKKLFQQLNIPTPQFFDIHSLDELEQACQELGFPCVLKTRRFGYDGKGQFIIRNNSDIQTAWETLSEQPLILESWISFSHEASLIAVRNIKGEIRFYPLVENIHKTGILHISRAPFDNATLRMQAENHMLRLLNHLNYVGILTVEFFVCDGNLIANEMAPRVHNSGHWTIEGAVTSQFANHIRAVCGLPLGATDARGFSAMLNCVGEEPNMEPVLQQPNAYYHSYHKAAKPRRKLAHININTETILEREEQLKTLIELNPFSRD